MFFADLLQHRNKENELFRQRNLDPPGPSWCFDLPFPGSFVE